MTRISDEDYAVIHNNVPKSYVGCIFMNRMDKIFVAKKERDKMPKIWFMDGMEYLSDESPIHCIARQMKEKFDIDILKNGERSIKLVPGTFRINEKGGGKRIEKVYVLKVSDKEEEKINKAVIPENGYTDISWLFPGDIAYDGSKFDPELKIIAKRLILMGRKRDYEFKDPKTFSLQDISEFQKISIEGDRIYEQTIPIQQNALALSKIHQPNRDKK